MIGVDNTPVTTMIVDDDATIRAVLNRFLRRLGHESVLAETGAEALAKATRHKLACILLDMRLPDMSGIDLVPALLRTDRFTSWLLPGTGVETGSVVGAASLKICPSN